MNITTSTLKSAFNDRIKSHSATLESRLEELADKILQGIYDIVMQGNLPMQQGINVCVELTSVSPDFSEFDLYLRGDEYDQESLEWMSELRDDGYKLDHVRKYWDGYTTFQELLDVCQKNPEFSQMLFKTCGHTMPNIADWSPLVNALERKGFLVGFTVNCEKGQFLYKAHNPLKAVSIEPVVSIIFEL